MIGDADKKQKAVDVLSWVGDGWLDALQRRFLTAAIIPTTAPFWSSMQNSRKHCSEPAVGAQYVLFCVVLSEDAAARAMQRGAAVRFSGSQGERGDMRKGALMMVLGKFEGEILIALLTSSHSLFAAVWLYFTLLRLSFCLNLSPSCTLFLHFTVIHDIPVLSSLSPLCLPILF